MTEAIKRLHSLGIMINGSFVFGLDDDDKDVFKRTVDWAVRRGLTTSTFHILTPYPGTNLFQRDGNRWAYSAQAMGSVRYTTCCV